MDHVGKLQTDLCCAKEPNRAERGVCFNAAINSVSQIKTDSLIKHSPTRH